MQQMLALSNPLSEISMTPIRYFFSAFILALTALWLLADSFFPEPFTYFSFRHVFVQYSGVMAIGVMSVAMMLALRPKWLEARLDGLDKMYRLHKWLGITALVAATLHWWWAKGSKWMVSWGWLEKPERGQRGEQTLGLVEGWFRAQRGFAESVGEWAFYAGVLLIVLALVKRFPYHLFAKTHKLMALLYLALAYHSVILISMDYWTQPVGWLMALLIAGGSIGAVYALAGRIGRKRKVQGTIESLTYYEPLRVMETSISVPEGWPGHKAGQFAFVTSDPKEGAHPYTIASHWDDAYRHIVFITKELGDHTSRLKGRLQTGMQVTVEGPYGCFDFQGNRERQIWIGAGIGITPFIARMRELAARPDSRPVDLFHPTADFDETAIARLTADAEAAGVRLHLLISGRDGRLDGETIRSKVPEWQSASIWFCGPPAFGTSLRDDFVAKGLARKDFHQELFQMR